jgi:cytochrome c553
MISTDQAAPAASQADRGTVLGYLNRGEIASQLQALGIDPSTAKDRVASLSDQEARSLAQRINTMPAGASDAGAILLLLVVIGVVWWFFFRK